MHTSKAQLALLALVLMAGCVDKTYEFPTTNRTPQESALAALKSSDADLRYKTLVELANSKALQADWAVKAMTIIVRTDPSSSVRALAVHNLGRVADQRVLTTLLEALEDEDVRVRIEAAWSLTQFDVPASGAEGSSIQMAQKGLIKVLADDNSPDVRLNAARALGAFKDRPVLTALIAALKDTTFSVRYEAESSLVRLTGFTFRGNANQWLAWVKETKDPFQDAGRIPPELVKPERNAFQKAGDDLYRFYVDWQGPAKR